MLKTEKILARCSKNAVLVIENDSFGDSNGGGGTVSATMVIVNRGYRFRNGDVGTVFDMVGNSSDMTVDDN